MFEPSLRNGQFLHCQVGGTNVAKNKGFLKDVARYVQKGSFLKVHDEYGAGTIYCFDGIALHIKHFGTKSLACQEEEA